MADPQPSPTAPAALGQATPARRPRRRRPEGTWQDTAHVVSPLYLPHLAAVREARQFVEEQLVVLGLEPCAQDASLLVCELAANAVLHARTPFTLHLRPTLEGGVRVEVHDHSPLPPIVTAPSATAMSGRGLNLVASLAKRWGSHPVLPAGPVLTAGPELSAGPAPAEPVRPAPPATDQAASPDGSPGPARPASGGTARSTDRVVRLDDEPQVLGKIVWFELDVVPVGAAEVGVEELLTRWGEGTDGEGAVPAPLPPGTVPVRGRHASPVGAGTVVSSLPAAGDLRSVVVRDLPVVELLGAKEAMDDLLRELQLLLLAPDAGASGGAGSASAAATASVGLISQPQRALDGELLVAARLDAAAREFDFARRQIREEVGAAAARGEALVTLHLLLPPWAGHVAARYRDAVTAAEQLARTRRDPREDRTWHVEVRQHYLGEIIRQLAAPA